MVNWGWGDVLIYDFIRDVVKDRYIWYSVGYNKFATQIKPKGKSKGVRENDVSQKYNDNTMPNFSKEKRMS